MELLRVFSWLVGSQPTERELVDETRETMRRNTELLERVLEKIPDESADAHERQVRLVKAVGVQPKRRRT